MLCSQISLYMSMGTRKLGGRLVLAMQIKQAPSMIMAVLADNFVYRSGMVFHTLSVELLAMN